MLVDPDADARELLLEELQKITSWPVTAISFDEAMRAGALDAAVPLCRPTKTDAVRALLPAGLELVTLQIRSATKWLGPELPSLKGRLIGVVSHWDDFRKIGRTMLEAAGVDAELLVVRDPRRPRWLRGLEQTGAIVCDAKTAANRALPNGPRIFVFPILSDAVREDLAHFSDVSQFL